MNQSMHIRIQPPSPPMLLGRASSSSHRTCPCYGIQMEASFNSNIYRTSPVSRCSLRWSKIHSASAGPQPHKCSPQMGPLVTAREKEVPSMPIIGDEKIGVLLLNLGGPETLEDVQPFLFNLFADPDIIRLPRLFRFLQKPLAQFISVVRAPKSKEGYASIGGGSPLRQITDAQA